MFEKEAEEYLKKLLKRLKIKEEDLVENQPEILSWEKMNFISLNVSNVSKAFQKGAEFGFNKANEWHYVDKEGLPEDKYKVLVQYVNGDYDIAFKFAGTWRGTSGNELRGVYAWKEIIPPKEWKE